MNLVTWSTTCRQSAVSVLNFRIAGIRLRRNNPCRKASASSSRERLDLQSCYCFIITITHFESTSRRLDSFRFVINRSTLDFFHIFLFIFSFFFFYFQIMIHTPAKADKIVPPKSIPLSLISRRQDDLRWMMRRRVGQDVARYLCIIHSCNAAWRGLAQNWILMNLISNLLWALCTSERD